MYGHFSRRRARAELCDGVTHFPFLFFFFFLSLSAFPWLATNIRIKLCLESVSRNQQDCVSACAGRETAGAAPRSGQVPHGGAELLPAVGGTHLSGTCSRRKLRLQSPGCPWAAETGTP